MFDIVTFGASSQDNFIKVAPDAFGIMADPQTGKELITFEHEAKIPVDEAASYTGGGAMNTAIALKKMGFSPLIVTAVGWDHFGEIIINRLREKKIPHNYVLRLQGVHTAFSTILTTKNGDRTAFVFSGANDHLSKEYLPPFSKLQKAKLFVVSHLRGKGHELLEDIFESKQKNSKLRIAWNPGSTQIELGISGLKKYLMQTDVFLLNKEEAERLLQKSHQTSTHELAAALHAEGPHIAVVTDGKNGAVAVTPRGTFRVTQFPGTMVNSTGAGDSFFAGLVAGLHHSKDIKTGLAYGSVNAASTIGHLGAQNGYLSLEEIHEALERHPHFTAEEIH